MPVREVREYNLNMARYYAWSNLTSYVRAAFRRHFLPAHRYTYRYVPPTVHTHYQLTPYHEWTSSTLSSTQTECATVVRSNGRSSL